MRIVIATHSLRRVGGIETYLNDLLPELVAAGHRVAVWHEVDIPTTRARIQPPPWVETWCVAQQGRESSLASLRAWRPDVAYIHGLSDPGLEADISATVPVVFCAHAYHGTCISGAKTFKRPIVMPCDRQFGRACLAQYYPRRCGGLNPFTMVSLYRKERQRHNVLRGYRAIVTLSEHIRREYIHNGVSSEQIHCLPYYSRWVAQDGDSSRAVAAAQYEDAVPSRGDIDAPWRLLFLGRMDRLKGGETLLDAVGAVRRMLGHPVHLAFGGDGVERSAWEGKAEKTERRYLGVTTKFLGWLDDEQQRKALRESDLLVVPSLWPEPLGLVGPEAGAFGVPAAAFDVGGISQWLQDRVNGHLAPGSPPTAAGLTNAIVACLADSAHYQSLRQNAQAIASRATLRRHVEALVGVLEKAGRH